MSLDLNRNLIVYSFFSEKESLIVEEDDLIKFLEESDLFDRDDTAWSQIRKMEYQGDLKRIIYYDNRPTLIELK